MKIIRITDRIVIRQVKAKTWHVVVDGAVVFVTFKGQAAARANAVVRGKYFTCELA